MRAPGGLARGRAGTFVLALAAALALKAFHASAGADAHGWLLAPTAWLVGLVSGQRFEPEPGIGWLSREAGLVIAPACAGVNHLVIAFCTLVLGFAPSRARPGRRARFLAGAALLAYAATLVANAARIALGIALPEPPWLPAEQAHRLEGVAVHLGSLWLLALAAARGSGGAGVFRAGLLPLLVYLAVTLALPLANGAHARPEFWPHARVVLGASLGLAALLGAGAAAVRGLRRSAAAAARAPCRASARRPCRPPPRPRA